MLWTVLLVVYLAGLLVFALAAVIAIFTGKSYMDLIVGGFIWPFLLIAHALRRDPPN